MPVYEAPSEAGGAEDSLDDEAASGSARLGGPSLNCTLAHRVILKRGSERMVLFQGWPEDSVLMAFQALGMTVGLALTADDFAKRRLFDSCCYLFIGAKDQRRTAFAAALRDLARANWSIDREASWPVIVSSYEPRPSTQDQRQRRSIEQWKFQRMEA